MSQQRAWERTSVTPFVLLGIGDAQARGHHRARFRIPRWEEPVCSLRDAFGGHPMASSGTRCNSEHSQVERGAQFETGYGGKSLSRKGGEVDIVGWVKPTDLQARQGLPVVGFTHPTTIRPGLWNRLEMTYVDEVPGRCLFAC